MSKEVWVFAEQKDGEPLETTRELISEGRRLADQLKTELCALLLGCHVECTAGTLGQYGADKVFWAENDEWRYDQPEEYAAVVSGLIKEHDPALVLLSSTSTGEDLAARLAARVRTGLTSRCDRLQLSSDGVLQQTYPGYKSRAHVTVAYPNSRPQMATLQPGAVKVRKMENPREPIIERIDPATFVTPGSRRTRVVGMIKADPKTIDISEAERVVAGGRGVSAGEGFQLIAELADLLGASLAGSRMAVDDGCIGKERQIGQSGKTISPDVLISCGISGANAHTIGLRDTRTIIAINKDKNAPMMKIADLGVVGDFYEVAPALIERLRPIVSVASEEAGNAGETGEIEIPAREAKP